MGVCQDQQNLFNLPIFSTYLSTTYQGLPVYDSPTIPVLFKALKHKYKYMFLCASPIICKSNHTQVQLYASPIICVYNLYTTMQPVHNCVVKTFTHHFTVMKRPLPRIQPVHNHVAKTFTQYFAVMERPLPRLYTMVSYFNQQFCACH